MTGYSIGRHAYTNLQDIYRFSVKSWGERQADRYIRRLFETFARIAEGQIALRPIPADISAEGSYTACGRHFIYWRKQRSGTTEIVAVIDQRRAQERHIRAAFRHP